MTVVASYIYRAGKRAEELPITSDPFEADDGNFAWIGLTEPTINEMASLGKMFGLHPLAMEDALNGKQVPKVDIYGDQLFVIVKTAHLDGEPRRVCRRPFGLSYAANAGASSMA